MIFYSKIKLYINLMRLKAPIGIWLLLFPCWWGLAYASQGFPSLKYLLLYIMGAIIMRSAGCVYNDWVDRDIDADVERTKHRPLAAKKLDEKDVYILLMILLTLSFCILVQLPLIVIALGGVAVVLVGLYPWMKRIFAWPQLFLGITFNWGVLMGVLTVHSHLNSYHIALFFAGVFWTLGYDTIYALQDQKDDVRLKIQSTAVAWGQLTKPLIGCSYLLSLLCLFYSGYGLVNAWPYFCSLFIVLLQMLWQILTLDVESKVNCSQRFYSNAWVGVIIFVGIVFSKFLT